MNLLVPQSNDSDFQYVTQGGNPPVLEFKNPDFSGQVSYFSDSDIFQIDGRFPNLTGIGINYWAANPVERRYSYSGSGLPYPNPESAYEETPNRGKLQLDDAGGFSIKLMHPSGYYIRQGKILVKPHVNFQIDGNDRIYTVNIADNMPYRSLKNLPNRPNRSTLR